MEKGTSRNSRALCDPSYTSSTSDSDSDDNVLDKRPELNDKQSENSNLSAKSKNLAPSFSMTMKSAAEPTRIQKIPGANSCGGFKIALASQSNKSCEKKRVATNVVNVFDDDDTEVTEEMPPAAKMRMRNLGKGTPTASGPNSFAKGRMGFCNSQKILQRELDKSDDEPEKKKKKF